MSYFIGYVYSLSLVSAKILASPWEEIKTTIANKPRLSKETLRTIFPKVNLIKRKACWWMMLKIVENCSIYREKFWSGWDQQM